MTAFHACDGNIKHWSSGTAENAQDLAGITNNSTTEKNTGSFCIRKLSGIMSKITDEKIVKNSQSTVGISKPCVNGNFIS